MECSRLPVVKEKRYGSSHGSFLLAGFAIQITLTRAVISDTRKSTDVTTPRGCYGKCMILAFPNGTPIRSRPSTRKQTVHDLWKKLRQTVRKRLTDRLAGRLL